MNEGVQLSFLALLGLALLLVFLLVLVLVLYMRLKLERQSYSSLAARMVAIEGQMQRHELGVVESRLNPHLFKNILNSIQSHAFQTYHALDKLAYVLDYILYESQRRLVSPREEVDFAINLIEVNKIKLSPLFDLKVQVVMPGEEAWFDEQLMAPMLSVDLIENAFKHADVQSPDAFIAVHFQLVNHQFLLRVANKISEKERLIKQRSGLGSGSLTQRLHALYGVNHSLQRTVEHDVYIVELKIDFLAYKNSLSVAR